MCTSAAKPFCRFSRCAASSTNGSPPPAPTARYAKQPMHWNAWALERDAARQALRERDRGELIDALLQDEDADAAWTAARGPSVGPGPRTPRQAGRSPRANATRRGARLLPPARRRRTTTDRPPCIRTRRLHTQKRAPRRSSRWPERRLRDRPRRSPRAPPPPPHTHRNARQSRARLKHTTRRPPRIPQSAARQSPSPFAASPTTTARPQRDARPSKSDPRAAPMPDTRPTTTPAGQPPVPSRRSSVGLRSMLVVVVGGMVAPWPSPISPR